MMTVIEKQAMDAVIAINRKTKDDNQIDWEQRRYEIAKAVMANDAPNGKYSEDSAKFAVACADALIKELTKDKSVKK